MKSQTFIVTGLTLVFLSTLILQLSRCHAAPGELDPTFAGTGGSRIGFSGGIQSCYGAAVQADGKLVLAGETGAGEFEVVRFDTNNLLDASFGVGGAAITPFMLTNGFFTPAGARVVQIQADGKIIAAGWVGSAYGSGSDFALARYHPDGSLDSSFGTGGEVDTDLGANAGIQAMAILPDGRILAAGYLGYDFVLARYETNGVLDPSFGSGGVVSNNVNNTSVSDSGATALLVHGDYYVVGSGADGSAIAVLAYTTNGVLDPTFGGGEVITYTGYSLSSATALGFQQGNNTFQYPGNLVVAGYAGNSPLNTLYVIVRYNLDGTLDTTFDGSGMVTGAFAAGDAGEATAVLVQGFLVQPRKITIAGTGSSSTTAAHYFGMARYNGDGTLDTTFGTNGTGKLTLSFGPAQDDEANTMVYDFGRFVLAGTSWRSVYGNNNDFAAARFNADGSLDTTFGNQGEVTADVCGNGWARAVAIQSDGKIVLAGQGFHVHDIFALARYNPDGTVDSSFGVNGRLASQVGTSNAAPFAVATQPDGKIIAAGWACQTNHDTNFALVRYLADGSLDASFGSTGQVFTPFGSQIDKANAMALQPDGKIVAAGSSFNGVKDVFAVARYTTNGALDPTFGGTGKVTTGIGSGDSVANGVRIQADGKIVVAGYAVVASSTNFALARFNADGSLDDSFGSLGQVLTDFGSGHPALGHGLALQPDGRIIVAGSVTMGGVGYVALARYATNGALDLSFNAGGKVTTQVGLTNDQANAVAVLPDGKIVVAGTSIQGVAGDFAILRYNPDGSLDNSYGIGGKQVVSFADDGGRGSALALDQIGRAVVVGNSLNLFGVVRLASEPYLKMTSLRRGADGQVTLHGLGVPEAGQTLYDSPDLIPGDLSVLDSVTPDAGGFWEYQDTNAVGTDRRFYRLSYP